MGEMRRFAKRSGVGGIGFVFADFGVGGRVVYEDLSNQVFHLLIREGCMLSSLPGAVTAVLPSVIPIMKVISAAASPAFVSGVRGLVFRPILSRLSTTQKRIFQVR